MKRRNALIAASASLLTLGLGGLAACSETKLQLKGVDMTGADYAKDFQLTDHNGQTRTLKDFHGKLVIIFFGYTQCSSAAETLNTMSTCG